MNAIFMFISSAVALTDTLERGFFPLFLSACITAIVGAFPLIFVPADTQVSTKEVYLIVVFAWIACFLFGMLPYVLYGGEFTVVNAWFESVSGFTTTGSSILSNVEALPKGIILWRSFTHFVGGVGVVLFAMLVLPSLRSNKTRLTKAEVSPLALENFKLKSQETVRVIITVYLACNVAAFLALWIAGMGLFDAVCHAFSTVATGGFSTKNASIAAYNSPLIEFILIFFMALSGIHFGMIYKAFTGNPSQLFRSAVVKFYLASLAICAIVIAANLFFADHVSSYIDSLRNALFHVVSLATTTGFTTTNISVWPPFSILVLSYLMVQCACAGSTAGGIKVDRVVVLLKTMKVQVRRQQHPNAVVPVKVGDVKVDDDTVSSILLYIVTYVVLIFVSTILLSLVGLDLHSSFSLTLSNVGNVGAGYDVYSPANNLSAIPTLGKYLLSLVMFLGRLEIYGLLILLYLRSWR